MFGLETTTLKLIGAGLLILALIGAIMGLINYGQKLGKLEAENKVLEEQVVKANQWRDGVIEKLERFTESMDANTSAVNEAWASYDELVMRPPQIVTSWREVAAEAPETIVLGDCDSAATNAWDVLKGAGLIGEKTWEDTSYGSPLPPHFSQELAKVRRLNSQDQTLNLYLSPYPNRPLYDSVGTYQLSPNPLYHARR